MADLASRTDDLRGRLAELTEIHHVPGAALGIIQGDEQVEVATGVTSLETGLEATTDTIFQIGSIGKSYTATLVMQLVDDGKVALDVPVVEYLPDLRLSDDVANKTITVRQLLSHTSGIDGDHMQDYGRGDDCLERYVASLADLAQNMPPGTCFSYCNSGYVLAGRLIEVMRDSTYDAALKEHILSPLGATRSTMLPEEVMLHRFAVGHVTPPGTTEPIVAPRWMLPRALGPAGLLCQPVGELLAFGRMHLESGKGPDGATVLSPESVAAMQEEQVVIPDPYVLGRGWGLGWILFDWGSDPVIGHDGNTIGQAASLRLVPSRRLAVALLMNGGQTKAVYDILFDEIFQELTGMSLPKKPSPMVDPAGIDLVRYAGIYERAGVRITIEVTDDGLRFRLEGTSPHAQQMPDPEPIEMRPIDEETFLGFSAAAGSDVTATFFDFDGERPGFVHLGARATPRVG